MDPFIGEIRIFGFDYAPRGWAACNGQLLPIIQNQALFSIVGNQFGGDGKTNFGLPNLQGRAPLHQGRGPGLTARTMGNAVGQETVALTEGQVSPHTHAVPAVDGNANSQDPANLPLARGGTPSGRDFDPWNTYASDNAPAVAMHASAIQPAGSGLAHENRQPYLSLNFCIALMGIYPSRS